jgi:hypothetical protein
VLWRDRQLGNGENACAEFFQEIAEVLRLAR